MFYGNTCKCTKRRLLPKSISKYFAVKNVMTFTRRTHISSQRRMTSMTTGEEDEDLGIDSKKYKVELNKKLEEDFNLEKTISKYRDLYRTQYSLEPRTFSLDCSLPATLKKRRLVELMGSNVIKLNDMPYWRELERKLRLEMKNQMDAIGQQLANEERLRMRKLMSQGVISLEELRRDEAGDFIKAKTSKNEKAIHESTPDEYRNLEKSTALKSSKSASCQKTMKPSYKTGGIAPRRFYKQHHHPLIKEMEEEQTVKNLYRLADQVIPVKNKVKSK